MPKYPSSSGSEWPASTASGHPSLSESESKLSMIVSPSESPLPSLISVIPSLSSSSSTKSLTPSKSVSKSSSVMVISPSLATKTMFWGTKLVIAFASGE